MNDTTRSIEYYREQLNRLLQKDFRYLMIGSIVTIALLTYGSLAVYKNNYNIFAPEESGPSVLSVDEKSENIEKIIKEQKLDLDNIKMQQPTISEQVSQTGTLTLPDEDKEKVVGEISAISSGQVTYTDTTYIVAEGDTLAIIAEKVYGDPGAWQTIAEANGIWNPDDIYVGMELQIPR